MTTISRKSLLLPVIILLTLIPAGLVPSAHAQATGWQQIPIPQLPPFHPAEPKRIPLPNGMIIFLQEDHELPLDRRLHSHSRRLAGRAIRQGWHG